MFDSPLRRYLRDRLGLKNGTALNLLVVLVRLSQNERGHSWASLAYLGQCIERATRTVREALRELRSLGFLKSWRTGRELCCTPVWEALGLDPQNPAVPATGRPQTDAREAANETPSHDSAPAEPARDTHEPASEREADDGVAPAASGPAADQEASRPAHAEVLAQVRDRFGVEAERDIAELLRGEAQAATCTAPATGGDRPDIEPKRMARSALLLSALCALPGGTSALRTLVGSRLPAERAIRVVERVLAYDRQKRVRHAGKFIRSLVADADEELCNLRERAEAERHDYQPEATVRRAPTVDPELAAHTLRRRDIRGMLINERSALMRQKLERELAGLDASIAARSCT